jgi:integrase
MLTGDYKLNTRRSLERAEDGIEHLRGFFGLYKAVEITTDVLTRYAVKRQEEGAKPATFRYELTLLKRMFSLAIRARQLVHAPYFPTIVIRNTRIGFFEEAEFVEVLRHLDADLSPAVEFAYCTGWRIRSEILKLQWRQVDFQAGTVRLEPGTTKNDEGRVFPFRSLPQLEAVLRRQRERTDLLQQETGQIVPVVFHRSGKAIKDFRKQWREACKQAGVPGRLLHDFRRTAVRNLERAGVPRSVAMELVGHKTESIYRRYAIFSETDLAEGVAKLAALHDAQSTRSSKVVEIGSRKVSAK